MGALLKEDGSRYIHFESVTVLKEGRAVAISSHKVNPNDLRKKMHNDNIVHLNDTLLDSEGHLTKPQDEGSDLVPTPSVISDNKDNTPNAENQISEQEQVSPIENKIAEWSKKLGVPVSVYRSVDEIPNAQARAAINAGQAVRGQQTYMLQLTDKHNNTLMVELSGDGFYWNINTAGVFKTSYGKNKKVVYNRQTTGKQFAETVGASQGAEQSGTQTPSSLIDTPTPSVISDNKDNTPNAENQISEQKSPSKKMFREVVMSASLLPSLPRSKPSSIRRRLTAHTSKHPTARQQTSRPSDGRR